MIVINFESKHIGQRSVESSYKSAKDHIHVL
ncbi:hypothetical protein SHLI107390_05200 [Shewanella livingstonensis]